MLWERGRQGKGGRLGVAGVGVGAGILTGLLYIALSLPVGASRWTSVW